MTLADGSTAEREVVVHRGAVALVPMVDPDHVCLLNNHRYAVATTLLEVPLAVRVTLMLVGVVFFLRPVSPRLIAPAHF